MPQFITIKNQRGAQRLDQYLKRNYPHIAFSLVQKWLRTGQIRLNGKRIHGAIIVQTNDLLRLPPQADLSNALTPLINKPKINVTTLANLKNNILFENMHFVALNKPAGLASQGGTKVNDAISFYLDSLCSDVCEPLRIVHRLDRDTSGVLLLAKTLLSSQLISRLIVQRDFHKYYLAIVVGKVNPIQGLIELPIGKMSGALKEKMSSHADLTSDAVTQYHVIASHNDLTLICFKPTTGRTHQLRVHSVEALKCPILGDGKYGGKLAYVAGCTDRLHLHAWKIGFNLCGSEHQIVAPLPDHFTDTLARLGFKLCDAELLKKAREISER